MHKKYTEKQIDFYISLYLAGKNTKQIEKEYQISDSSLSYHLGKRGLRRTRTEIKTQYSVDENYFKVIDTPQKAYVLGFWYADGCNNEKIDRIDLQLNSKDVEILNLIKLELKYSGPIRNWNYVTSKNKKEIRADLSISNKVLSKDLRNKGCMAGKSLVLRFPTVEQVPRDLIHHFIRGYFDGDGNINKKSVQSFLCVTLDFGESLRDFLEKLNISSYLYKEKKNKIYRLRIGKKKDCLRFLNYIYEDSEGLRLERKYIIYKKHLTNFNSQNNI